MSCYKTAKGKFSRVLVYFVNFCGIFCCSYCSFTLWFHSNLWKALLKKQIGREKSPKKWIGILISKYESITMEKKYLFYKCNSFQFQKQLNKLMLNENYFTPVKDNLPHFCHLLLFWASPISVVGAGRQCKLNWESSKRGKDCNGKRTVKCEQLVLEGWTCKCDQKTGLNLGWVPAKLSFTALATTGLSLSFSWEWAQHPLLPFLNWCSWESDSKVPGKYLAAMLNLGRVGFVP